MSLQNARAPRAAVNPRNRTYGALEAFPEILEQFTPPEGEFEPRGAWSHPYAVRLFGAPARRVGWLELRRSASAEGTSLAVTTRLNQSNGVQEQIAALRYAPDLSGSLNTIQIKSRTQTRTGEDVPAAGITIDGVLRGSNLEFTRAGKRRAMQVRVPLVANFTLFDTVQRLEPGETKPLEFTLLDDGDIVKPGQRLLWIGSQTGAVSGGLRLTLDCWEQTGYGVLPAHYWVDGRRRLLFAIAGQKGFFYDDSARRDLQESRRPRRDRP
jgi:hypothetical protein